MKKTFVSNNPKISIKYDGTGDLLFFLHGIGGNKNNWDLNYFFAAFKAVSISSIKSSIFSSPVDTLIKSIGALASVS